MVIVSSSSHRTPNTLGIYCLLYAKEKTQRERALGSLRMGAGCQKNQPVNTELELSVLPPKERQRTGHRVQSPMSSDVIICACRTKPHKNYDGVQGPSGFVNTVTYWEDGMPEREGTSVSPHSSCLPCTFLPFGCS